MRLELIVTHMTPAKSVPRLRDPVNPTLASHEWVKAVYITLLSLCEDKDLILFWEGNPLTLHGKRFSTHDLLSHLWLDKAQIPIIWDYQVGETLEAFLIHRGISMVQFYQRMLNRNNRSSFMPGKYLLKWFYPVMSHFFSSLDPRDMMIRLIPFFTENLYEGHLHRRVNKTVKGEWVDSILIYITDKTFQECIFFDFGVHANEQAKASPGIFGMPPFEDVGVLADCRPVSLIVWSGKVEERDGYLFIESRRLGQSLAFNDFCKSLDLDLVKFGIPDKMGILMEKDYFCPIRNRIVLHAGSFYDAPIYLQRIRHRKLGKVSRNVLNHLVMDLEGEEDPSKIALNQRHIGLLAKVKESLVFTYYGRDESISVNGEYLAKSIPAKILRHVLTAHTQEGKLEFEYREFKRDIEITLRQKNTNFEVRFYRLMEKLEEKCPGLRFEKQGRGKFALKTNCKIIYEESIIGLNKENG